MHISEIHLRKESDFVRVEAQVTWEETDKSPLTFFIETSAKFQDIFGADPNGFLVSCVLPAWHAGEQRLKIDGTLCPVLCHRIRAAFATLRTWYPELGSPPTIEGSQGFRVYHPFHTQAASFLSCGVDSLATLRSNKLLVPADHPSAIKAAILIDYIKAPGLSAEEGDNRTRKRLEAAARVTADAGIYSIPIRTNILRVDDDGYFFAQKWHGAVLASLAYFFSRAFNKVYIASGENPAYLVPWGSHPLLDPYYSSAYLHIEHHGIEMSRFEKIALLVEWPVGFQNILVCEGRTSGKTNCGRCEKCIRTMTALVALGKLRDCSSFPADDVSPALLSTVEEYDMIHDNLQAACYSELIPDLTRCGRNDLVVVIQQFLLSYAQR